MAEDNLKHNNDNPNYSFKLTTDESRGKELVNISNRNENSGLNSKRGKKKKLIKAKNDDGMKNKSAMPANKRMIEGSKPGETKVNNIIIHINNQINTLHTSQNIQVNTANNMKEMEVLRHQDRLGHKDQNQHSPNGFVELKIDNNEVNFKYNNSVIEASQNKLFLNLSRLLFSPTCDIYYKICILLSTIITLIAVLDIFIQQEFMNTIWLFVIEMVFITIIALDITCRIYVIKTEYFSNIPLIGLDILLIIFTPIQIIRFSTQAITTVAHILHILFALCIVLRFITVLIILRRTLKRQEDVRQNVEEIINFSEMMEDPNKNFDAVSTNKNKKLKKITPAISFVDDEAEKNKKGLNLIKKEKKEKELLEAENIQL